MESAYLAPDVPIQIGNSVMQVFVAEREGRAPVDPRKGGPRMLGTSAAMQKLVAVLPQLAAVGRARCCSRARPAPARAWSPS